MKCSCTPVALEERKQNKWIISVKFEPGCALCATCTCKHISMEDLEDDRWTVYVAINAKCFFHSRNSAQCVPPGNNGDQNHGPDIKVIQNLPSNPRLEVETET